MFYLHLRPMQNAPQKNFSKSVQAEFNSIKGVITELNDAEKFCSITLLVGNKRKRPVNLVAKKEQFDVFNAQLKMGDKVRCSFYLVSNNKNERWHTNAFLLSISIEQ